MSLENLFFHFEVFLSCIEFSLTLLQGKSVHRTRTEKKYSQKVGIHVCLCNTDKAKKLKQNINEKC